MTVHELGHIVLHGLHGREVERSTRNGNEIELSIGVRGVDPRIDPTSVTAAVKPVRL